ncbi:hypothetical protein [Spiroplasma sp. DGKH1]|uniref:hypothetical protein n=1 Tax=Spiroplasma sp. DGKH1 TaxID=3050074 RepID=UPI0034C5B5BA
MKGYLDTVQAEFRERVFSSRKRVIKFVAICFVPFLYAFICIWAFWNPIPQIGSAPMAIINNDKPVVLIAGKSVDGNLALGAGQYYTDAGGTQVPITIDTDWNSIPNGTKITTTSGTVIEKAATTIHSKAGVVDDLVSSWEKNKVPNISYNKDQDKFRVKVNDNMELTNLKYLSGKAAANIASQNSDGSWNVKDQDKYWVQLQMPENLTGDLIGYIDATLREIAGKSTPDQKSPTDFINDLKHSGINFWSTYKHNFLFGQFMYIFNEFKSSLLVDLGPEVLQTTIQLLLEKELNDVKANMLFKAPITVNEQLTIAGHGSTTAKTVDFNIIQDQEYVIRNQEMLGAIKAKYPSWTLPSLTLEGTTGTDITQDWQPDGFLSQIANLWNTLMSGDTGNLLATALAPKLSEKLTAALPTGLGSLAIDADGVKKLFGSAGNIAGLLEQEGAIIPNTAYNFPISGKGAVSVVVKNYKDLITMGTKMGSFSKMGLVSLLGDGKPSKTPQNAYVLAFGDLNNPAKGTFIGNFQTNIDVLSQLILGGNVAGDNTVASQAGDLLSALGGGINSLLFPDLGGIMQTNIVGSDFNPYGIGLGQFFLCIGLWVGTLMQTFVFDRAKRVKTAGPFAWYLGKTTLMLVTAWIQCTILMLTVYGLGWSMIGPTFGLVYLWMMFTVTVFVIIEQALWFSLRDETIGKFLCVILLIINLSSGWGTFPTFMQAGFFDVISYLAPYTYSIHAQGAIIYSIGIVGSNWTDASYVLQQFAILLVWIVGFLAIGLGVSIQRNREMFYGTHNSKKLATILVEEHLEQYVNPKTNRAMWSKLPFMEMDKIREKVNARYPEEGQFKWYQAWKAKHHPEHPAKASASDEEIMRRND